MSVNGGYDSQLNQVNMLGVLYNHFMMERVGRIKDTLIEVAFYIKLSWDGDTRD